MTALLTPPIYVTADVLSSPFFKDSDSQYFRALHDLEKTLLTAGASSPINVTPPHTPPKISHGAATANDSDPPPESHPRISISFDRGDSIHAPLAQRPSSHTNRVLSFYEEDTATETTSSTASAAPDDENRYNHCRKEDLLDVGHQIRSGTHDPAWRRSLASISDVEDSKDTEEKPREQSKGKRSSRARPTSFYETCVIPGCLIDYGSTESSGMHYARHLNAHNNSGESAVKKVGATLLEKYFHQAFSPDVAKRLLARTIEISLEASIRHSVEAQKSQKGDDPTRSCVVPGCTVQLDEASTRYRHYLAHIRNDGKGSLVRVTFDEISAYFLESLPVPVATLTVEAPTRREVSSTCNGPRKRVQSSMITPLLCYAEPQDPRLSFDSRRSVDFERPGSANTIQRKPVPPQGWHSSRVPSGRSSFDTRSPRPMSVPLQARPHSMFTPGSRLSEVTPRSGWDTDDDDEVTLVQSIKTSFRQSRVFSFGNGNGNGNEMPKAKGRKKLNVLERLKGFLRSGRFSRY